MQPWLAVFCAILCAANIMCLSEGTKLSAKKYVVVLTIGSGKGSVAKINFETSASSISYSRQGATKLVVIRNGKVSLKKKLDKSVATELNNTKITILASDGKSTTVSIFILPLYFGDNFVDLVQMKSNSKVEKFFHSLKRITPIALLRSIRRPNKIARRQSIAQLNLDTKILKIKKIIFEQLAKQFGSDAVFKAYLHIKDLFSEKMMEEMEEESECIEPTHVKTCERNMKYRTIDGSCNNFFKPNIGASNIGFSRIRPAIYFDPDGLNDPIGYPNQPNAPTVPSPHVISRDFIKDEIAATSTSNTLTHAVMQFGQFIDHDLDLAVEVEFEGRNICLDVPCNGSSADFTCPCYPILPDGGADCIRVTRSAAVCQKHGYPKPREQINVNTAYIDASQVYGSTKEVAEALRATDPVDNGLLKSLPGPDGELLPLDPSIEEQLCTNLGGCFIAGDVRSNEQQSLASIHALFLREHNRIAKFLKDINSHWDGEIVYQETRRIMGAVMQKITYKDFLPVVLGSNLPYYQGYRPHVDPGISNAFATAAFRFGHSLIRPSFDLLDEGFNPVNFSDPIELRFMFFNNTFIQRNGINPILLGLIGNFSERVDRILSSGITRHLFERENSPGSNLAALNIHRSRDHGLPGYNEFRRFCGLGNANTFADTVKEIKDPQNIQILKRLYNDNPALAELWVAGLAETPSESEGTIVGPTFKCLIKDQFLRTRDGDRFFYERKGVWQTDQLKEIKKASLSRIYCDNLNVVSIQQDAFKAPTNEKPRVSCERIPRINLCQWKDVKYFSRPCLRGTPVLTEGKCECKCSSAWIGTRCESRITTAVPWLVTILNKSKIRVCSGALVVLKTKVVVLTTTKCANNASNGFVRLANKKIIRLKRIFRRSRGLAIITFAWTKQSKGVFPIRIARFVFTRRPSYVAVRENNTKIRFIQNRIIRHCIKKSEESKKFKSIFSSFNKRNNFCTLPAGYPSTINYPGSPLVQYHWRKAYLVGLLTRLTTSSLPGERFGKYIKVAHLF